MQFPNFFSEFASSSHSAAIPVANIVDQPLTASIIRIYSISLLLVCFCTVAYSDNNTESKRVKTGII